MEYGVDDNRLNKYYRTNRYGWRSLVYHCLMTDRYFRSLFHFGPRCGAITCISFFLIVLVLIYTFTSWMIFRLNTKKFSELYDKAEKKLPRRESVLQVRPAYNCINKHLQQADIFLDKTKKVVRKEQLEVEILNSRINNITELLNPGDHSPWPCSQTPKGYFRDINTPSRSVPAANLAQ